MGNTSFYSLGVSDIRKETADTVSIAFDVPVDVRKEFAFVPGQYLTFKANIGGEEVRRAYSICSGPDEDELRVAIKKVDKGVFSSYANDILKVGDKLDVMPPMGNFKLFEKAGESYLAIAAGSGITPIMSMIKSAMEKGANFTLLYGSKTEADIIFKEELDRLSAKFNYQLKVVHVLSRESVGSHTAGRIDSELIKNHLAANKYDQTFLCGPELMINTASEALTHKGYAKDQIHFELFTAPLETAEEAKPYSGEKFTAQVTMIIDDEESVISVDSDGESVLEAGLMDDLDLPFACKGGVCCTCKCQVKEGKVEMDVNYALDDDEVEDGYVLACQAHPRTEKVVLDFDV